MFDYYGPKYLNIKGLIFGSCWGRFNGCVGVVCVHLWVCSRCVLRCGVVVVVVWCRCGCGVVLLC